MLSVRQAINDSIRRFFVYRRRNIVKGNWPVRALLCLGTLVLGAGVVRGQSTGSIVARW
jgi:hypothetical protein